MSILSFLKSYWNTLIALVSGPASAGLVFVAAAHESSGQTLAFWISSYLCCVLTAFLVGMGAYNKLKEANLQLEARGLTAARIQMGKDLLSVLGESEKQLLEWLLIARNLKPE